jgi:cytochrome b
MVLWRKSLEKPRIPDPPEYGKGQPKTDLLLEEQLLMSAEEKILVWDVPTRLFHWSLVICFVGAWITHEMEVSGFWLHTIFGYSALALALWRISWGLVGTRYARFSHFLASPGAAMNYLRNAPAVEPVGHNPAGGWAIMAMLALVTAQAVSGLFNGGEILMEGPWYHAAPKWLQGLAHEFHEINFNLLLGLVGLHLGALLLHWVRRRHNLIPAMITGYRDSQHSASDDARGIGSHKALLAAFILAIAVLVVWAVVSLAPPASTDPLEMF